MTIVFSFASQLIITMTVDSAITNEFSDRTEYDTGRKAYSFDGIGCVTTWGERSGNTIGDYLNTCQLEPSKHSVVELAELVNRFLTREYLPDQGNLGEVGYHVGGFDRNHLPRLYHIFWSFDRPRIASQDRPRYGLNDHSPESTTGFNFLYNGRNDLAETVVAALINEQLMFPQATKFNVWDPTDAVCFGDLVTRFASELTPQVGPPFLTFIIAPNNKIRHVKNETFCPIDRTVTRNTLEKMGYRY